MHYLDLDLCDSATAPDIQSALITAVHAINSDLAETARLAIAFPQWEDAKFSSGRRVCEGTTGDVFRVFGEPGKLAQILTRQDVKLAMTCALLTAQEVRPVPAATSWVRFVRERGMDRRSNPATLRRLQRRAQARGEERGLEALPRMPSEKPFQKFSYKSGSTGQHFEIRVSKDTFTQEPVTGWAQSFSTYGLATGAGGVPEF